jgi:ketosteroid isomerase-like protein
MSPTLRFLMILGLVLGAQGTFARPAEDSAAIGEVLDAFHAAAADADRERYLGLMTADAVFLGTDDWERWPRPEFDRYVEERFRNGGWAYAAESRHVMLGPQGRLAWFDEIVVSPRWGRFRGTGVLRREDAGWKIAHYSLTILIPNESFEPISEMATQGFSDRKP